MSSSTSSRTSSLFTPLQFTGISQYSSDFQSILSRATSIAELPVQELQQQVSNITQEETELSTLGTAASAVGSALQTLGQLSTGGALSATSSDSSVARVLRTASLTFHPSQVLHQRPRQPAMPIHRTRQYQAPEA